MQERKCRSENAGVQIQMWRYRVFKSHWFWPVTTFAVKKTQVIRKHPVSYGLQICKPLMP